MQAVFIEFKARIIIYTQHFQLKYLLPSLLPLFECFLCTPSLTPCLYLLTKSSGVGSPFVLVWLNLVDMKITDVVS